MSKLTRKKVPTFDQLMIPLLQALKILGGSGTIDEIYEKVIELMGLSDEILDISHGESGNQSEVAYRLAWARTYLKKYGVLENSARGVWSIAKDAVNLDNINVRDVVQAVREQSIPKAITNNKLNHNDDNLENDGVEEPEEIKSWREKLKNILLSMDPSAFERLTQRLLRESGFIQVEVTGRTGDGGIDGKGIVRMNGILSFHMIFQCKKYQGSVTPSHIRDFRGAMQGRADKGLFITTGKFTREAMREATRDGAPPIDLVDGDQLIDKLKELGLGIKEIIVKDYDVDEEWFKKI